MKKFLSLLLVFVFCMGCFAGCTKDEPDASAATLAEAVTYLQTLYKDSAEKTQYDYDMPAKVMIGTTSFTVTWRVSVDGITVKESNKAGFWTIDLPDVNETETKYVLTATVKDAEGNTEDISFNRLLPVYKNDGTTEPEADKEYKLFMMQATVGKVLYAIAETQDGKYLMSTEDPEQAAVFKTEEAEGGYKLYTEIDGVKSYVYAYTVPYEDGSGKMSKYLCYSAENSSVWTYQQNVNAWFTTCADGTTYVMGTYSTFETFCISEATYISETNTGVTQFPAELLEKGTDAPEIPKAPEMTPEEIVDAAYELEVGGALTGILTLTGVITSVDTAYDSGYDNVTVTIVVGGKTDKPIQCFRLKGDGADKIGVGDTITVSGSIINYDNGSEKGKVEFNSGCTLDSYTLAGGEQGGNEGGNEGGEQGGTEQPELKTPEEIVNAAWELAPGATLGEYTLTGVITSVDTPYSEQYKNVTVTIVVGDMTDKPIVVYRVKGDGADIIAVGDTITVTGTLLNYVYDVTDTTDPGKVEFTSGCTLDSFTKAEGGTVTPPPAPDTTDKPDQGGTSTDATLTDGMKVVIYNPANKKALSSLASPSSSYYQKGVDVTISGTTVTGYADTEIWTVVANDDGSFSFEQGGKKIAMQAEFSSMSLGAVNDKWEVISLGGGLYNIKNTVRGNYIEWYASKDNWSTYSNGNEATDPLFQLSFYVVG